MSPNHKAIALLRDMASVPFKHDLSQTLPIDEAKRYALIAVQYLIEQEEMYENGEPNPMRYWREVKLEIERFKI